MNIDQKLENIKGIIISILFWIIILFVNNIYAKIIGVILCVLFFSTRYWEFLVNLIKGEKNRSEEAINDENTLPSTQELTDEKTD